MHMKILIEHTTKLELHPKKWYQVIIFLLWVPKEFIMTILHILQILSVKHLFHVFIKFELYAITRL